MGLTAVRDGVLAPKDLDVYRGQVSCLTEIQVEHSSTPILNRHPWTTARDVSRRRGYPVYCADLTRVGWITGLLPSALSAEYFKGELVPVKTLEVIRRMIHTFDGPSWMLWQNSGMTVSMICRCE